MKNILIHLFVQLFRKKQVATEEHFLIVSTTGLGDSLWGTPAIKALRLHYPHAYIAVLTSPLGKEVFSLNPHLNALFVVEGFFSLFKLFRPLTNKKFKTAFIFHTSQRCILPFCSLIGTEEIIGTEKMHKGLDHFLTLRKPLKMHHEVERRLEIVNEKVTAPALEFFIDPSAQTHIRAFLNRLNIQAPCVGIHPGAKDKFKQWDPECFIKVGNRLVKELGCKVFITGNKEEKVLADTIASQIEGALSVAGMFNLHQTAALITHFSVFLTNDTGPMHLACALNTPTIALFVPTDRHLCGPLPYAKATVIQKLRTCTPCLKKRCREPFCMLQISPEKVFQVMKAFCV